MKKTCSSKKSAFSLIELSIVLIIIGLLIAGITGGASLIKSSELRAAMSEARAFATSINGFYTQFGALPGDFKTVIGGSSAGNHNDHIEYYADDTTVTGGSCGPTQDSDVEEECSEGNNAWVQMHNAGTVDSNLVTAAETADASANEPLFGTNAPASKIKSAGWVFDYRDITNAEAFGDEPSSQNVVVLTGAISDVAEYRQGAVNSKNTGSKANLSTPALFSTDVLSIDSKIDDGIAGTGKVRGLNPGTFAFPTTAEASSTTNCYYDASGTFTYNTTDTVKSCAMTYQIDVNS